MLSLLASLAIGAVVSASASAFSYEVCLPGGTENFKDHKCKVVGGTEKWSWIKIIKGEEEKVVSKGGAFILKAGILEIKCTAVTATGNIKGGTPGTGESTNTFTGCKTATVGCEVKSPGQPNGTIKTAAVPTELKEEATKKVIEDTFKGTGTAGFVKLEFEPNPKCKENGYVTTTVKGLISGQVINLANGNTELVFPEPELAGNTLNAFGVAATLKGAAEVELANLWAFRLTFR
jgi:hypothetical protein